MSVAVVIASVTSAGVGSGIVPVLLLRTSGSVAVVVVAVGRSVSSTALLVLLEVLVLLELGGVADCASGIAGRLEARC